MRTQITRAGRLAGLIRTGWDLLTLLLLAAILLLLMLVGTGRVSGFLAPLRLVAGLAFVLFVPGYALQAALFPRPAEQNRPTRFALATGISIAILPPLALALDRLPWGLRPWPVALSLTLLTLVFSLVALARRAWPSNQERTAPALRFQFKSWWAAQNRSNRKLVIFLGVGLGIALLSALMIMIIPRPGDRFTEFYMLGSEGQAQDYPRQVTAGQTVALTVGIGNRESVAAVYRIQIKVGDQVLTRAGPVALENGKTWEQALEFVLLTAGDDQQILLFLEREGQPAPYRSLRLWINVKPAAAVP